MDKTWTCTSCGAEQTHATWCQACSRPRYPTRAIQLAEHILEHLADGLTEPLDILKAMTARDCYKPWDLTLAMIAQQMRLLTRDTSALARDIARARAARVTLDVLETGEHKDRIAVLKGWGVMTDVVKHEGEQITRHIVELHEGPPPKGGE